jgi:two-component system LytT family response regulator
MPARVTSLERGTLRVFDASRIARFRASDKYTLFECDDGEHVSADSLHTLEERLAPHGFLRVHRSELVNLARVRCLHPDNELELDDGTRVPVSRRSLGELRARLR